MMKNNFEKKIVPSANVTDYNVVQSDRPGNVYNMLMRF